MKILEAKSELVEQKDHPLFRVRMTHKIKETSASFHYIGPKFTAGMWNEILAFFKWSYAKTHGESQVRLFVHPTLGWKAWAFPQEASTGLSTTEMPDNPLTKEQRAQFNDEWYLYGTVHHHCAASAFQSGTDTANERDQEGIHITVGDMGKEVHSLHFRFYYKGCKFQPDMSEFWDVGEQMTVKAKEMKDTFGIEVSLGTIAERQMSQTSPKDTPFPELWMANLIEKKWSYGYGGFLGNGAIHTDDSRMEDPGYQGYPSRAIKRLRKWFRSAYKDDIKAAGKLTPELRAEIDVEIHYKLEEMADDKDLQEVLYAMSQHQVKDISELLKKFKEILLLENAQPPGNEELEIEEKPKDVMSMNDEEWQKYQQEIGVGQ